uniref:Small G protein signaling modulator 1 n=1 Tax=Panagrolaimus sp. JU765 TaxID=591449 RepID=A0AC34PUH8_9BILA
MAVKKLMEESANNKRSYIYGNVTTELCVAVENCLLHGLRRRLLGLFGVRTTLALLHSVAKNCGPAASVIKLISEQSFDTPAIDSSKSGYSWIRVALLEKTLCSIISFIFSSSQCRRYYDEEALMLDSSRGGMVAALLVGPCVVEYSLYKPMDLGYHDPTADELVQRSRIASTAGENNELLKGYLSLHRENTGCLTVKWTPNQLMHSTSEPASSPGPKQNSDRLWKYVVNINMQSIIYLHLHQQGESHPMSLVFVDAEGVQYAPFQFPPGQHCLSFLACLESGLAPFSRLDPPLWNDEGKGKILPRLKRKISSVANYIPSSPLLGKESTNGSCSHNGSIDRTVSIEINDYVFRIVQINISATSAPSTSSILPNSSSKDIEKQMDDVYLEEMESPVPETSHKQPCFSVPVSPYITDKTENSVDRLVRSSLGNACETMRLQILSRAFFGWLAYCRHLKTIRTHLSSLVTSQIIDPTKVKGPVDQTFWDQCRNEKKPKSYKEFIERTYCFGIKPEIRYDVWPYLIKMVPWDKRLEDVLPEMEDQYTTDLQTWGTIEEEVIRRDQEAFKAARLRQSSANGDFHFPPIREQSITSDVFEEDANVSGKNNAVEEETIDIIEEFGSNLHRIEKDVDRCDRGTEFFSKTDNLKRLKRVMCTYVWRHIKDGYIQGMCDIAAPLLVIFENEVITLECFEKMMERMRVNFPHGHGIENSLNNLRSMVQVMDPELFELMMGNSDFTHLYFAYRWFLLDFKRELTYENIYKVWEVILAAQYSVSNSFQLFFALALLTKYRHIVIENNMDFTDIIKFYNEMAEKHNAEELLQIAREKLACLQAIVREID